MDFRARAFWDGFQRGCVQGCLIGAAFTVPFLVLSGSYGSALILGTVGLCALLALPTREG